MGTLQPLSHESAVLETLGMENHGRIVNSNFTTMTRGGWNLLSDKFEWSLWQEIQ